MALTIELTRVSHNTNYQLNSKPQTTMAPQPHGKLSQKQQQPLRFRSILRRVHSSHNDSTSVATEDATSHCEHDHSNSSERIIHSKKKTSHRHLHSVGWGNLTIYEFPTILGDHPGVSDGGAPLTLAWNHEKRTVICLDYQEYIRKHLHNIQQNQMGRRRPANRRMSNHAMIEQHVHEVEGHEPQSSGKRTAPVKRLDAGTRLSRYVSFLQQGLLKFDALTMLRLFVEVPLSMTLSLTDLSFFVMLLIGCCI